MPVYLYRCLMCKQEFDSYADVAHRDVPQVCDQCGNGAYRVFQPAAVTIPPGFSDCCASDLEMTVEQCRAAEKKYSNLPSKPSKPSFEACLRKELDARGIRHPHRLVDPQAGFDKTCLTS